MRHEHKDRIEKWDVAFEKFKKTNPGKTFAEFSAQRVAKGLANGGKSVVLGANLVDTKDKEIAFEDAGREFFQKHHAVMKFEPHHRVIDYGCGSLRVGYHVMNFVDPGNYFGLDVTTDYIDIGKKLIGAALAERRPHLAAITPKSLADAKAFGADFVFSVAVAAHVHPEDTSTYFGNLQALAWKPGAQLFFNATISDEPERYRVRAWSRPMDFFIKSLPELRFEGLQTMKGHAQRDETDSAKERDHRVFKFVRH